MKTPRTTDQTGHTTDQPEKQLHIQESELGLTDDQRVSREDDDRQDGARVEPGPADKDRQPTR